VRAAGVLAKGRMFDMPDLHSKSDTYVLSVNCRLQRDGQANASAETCFKNTVTKKLREVGSRRATSRNSVGIKQKCMCPLSPQTLQCVIRLAKIYRCNYTFLYTSTLERRALARTLRPWPIIAGAGVLSHTSSCGICCEHWARYL
jgi:hypothetical protein